MLQGRLTGLVLPLPGPVCAAQTRPCNEPITSLPGRWLPNRPRMNRWAAEAAVFAAGGGGD